MKTSAYTLSTLPPGRKAVIDSIDLADKQIQRLMVLGLVEGAEIEHKSAAIGGDPIEFRLFGCSISLRHEHAQHFHVSPITSG